MPDRSALIGRLSRAERIVVFAGAIAVLIAVVNITRPSLARLQQREEKIAQRRERLAAMRDFAASDSTATGGAGASVVTGPRALGGRTPNLAAVELRMLLQRYADASRLKVIRLDVPIVPPNPGTTSTVPMIPATLTAIGDIRGVSQLLQSVHQGPRALEVTDLSIAQDTVLKGGMLQLTLSVRGPWIARD